MPPMHHAGCLPHTSTRSYTPTARMAQAASRQGLQLRRRHRCSEGCAVRAVQPCHAQPAYGALGRPKATVRRPECGARTAMAPDTSGRSHTWPGSCDVQHGRNMLHGDICMKFKQESTGVCVLCAASQLIAVHARTPGHQQCSMGACGSVVTQHMHHGVLATHMLMPLLAHSSGIRDTNAPSACRGTPGWRGAWLSLLE